MFWLLSLMVVIFNTFFDLKDHEKNQIIVHADKGLEKININDVYFIEKDKDQTIIHMAEDEIVTKKSFSFLWFMTIGAFSKRTEYTELSYCKTSKVLYGRYKGPVRFEFKMTLVQRVIYNGLPTNFRYDCTEFILSVS